VANPSVYSRIDPAEPRERPDDRDELLGLSLAVRSR
jgi:hypothetical protein